jgi:hypothetical protein
MNHAELLALARNAIVSALALAKEATKHLPVSAPVDMDVAKAQLHLITSVIKTIDDELAVVQRASNLFSQRGLEERGRAD